MFTLNQIEKGAVIEVAPCVDLPNVTGMDTYKFESPSPELTRIVFGYGPLYSHSPNPNMQFHHGATCVTFVADRDIAAGDELTMNYGPDYFGSQDLVVKEKHG